MSIPIRASSYTARNWGGDSMLSIDWRSPAAYAHTKTISAAGFAWEYLRRNQEYQEDFLAASADGNPRADRLERFVRRWGLRFPKRPRRIA